MKFILISFTLLFSAKSSASISKTEMSLLLRDFKEFTLPHANKKGEKFLLMRDLDSDWANAFARRWKSASGDEAHILVYGGFLNKKEIGKKEMALVLCHEKGHLYSGMPYSDSHNEISVEGQADYYAAHCLKLFLEKYPQYLGPITGDEKLLYPEFCRTNSKESEEICQNTIDAISNLNKFFSYNWRQPPPSLKLQAKEVVDKTLTTYPNEIQCRFDSMINGFLLRERPKCWYKVPGTF